MPENIIAEEWRPVVGFPYSVSNCGRVRSEHSCTRNGKIMRTRMDRYGYPVVMIQSRGRIRVRTVHGIVAEAFLGPRPFNQQVNHKNGDKTDNQPDNLEWVTPFANIKHALDVLGYRASRAEQMKKLARAQARLDATDITNIRSACAAGESQASVARKYDVHVMTINDVVHRRTWREV